MKFFSLLPILFGSFVFAGHHDILHLPGNDEPGSGKTIVLVS